MKNKIYISGKMTGVPNKNKDKFLNAEIALLKLGYSNKDIINPWRLEQSVLHWVHADYMKRDFEQLIECNQILLLDDWLDSKGARAEVIVASSLNFDIMFFKNNIISESRKISIDNFEKTIGSFHLLKTITD